MAGMTTGEREDARRFSAFDEADDGAEWCCPVCGLPHAARFSSAGLWCPELERALGAPSAALPA